ncbi:M23 family metallopeptidase [bacterium LRH843]|nr:M23 family metallopeptidase [bacterium LRH843]
MRKEENQRSSKSEENQSIQRFLRRRWVVPAIYLIAAAGVLSSVFLLQGKDESAAPENSVEVTDPGSHYGENAIEVATSSEIIKLPVENENDVKMVGTFYDLNASEEEQQDALVYYDNSYYLSKGVDFAHVDGESFNVAAALSGTVLKAEKDELLGYVVEINHDNGVVTHYNSLESLDVEVGSQVTQGEIIGAAGRNLYNKDAGIHVHFEIRQDGVRVNPNDVFEQPAHVVKEVAGEKEEDPADKEKEEAEKVEKADEAKKPAEQNPAEQPSEDSEKETPSEEEKPANKPAEDDGKDKEKEEANIQG